MTSAQPSAAEPADAVARDRRPVAIVGGGYSGTILAVELARLGVGSFLIDGSGQIGRGIAYSTSEPAHLLNVAAHNMSAFADRPDHFAARFEAQGGDRADYAERRFYGDYLGDILDEAVATGLVATVAAQAVFAEPGGQGWRIRLDDGRVLESSALVLATGNQSPEALPALADAGVRHVANPWGAEARVAIDEAIRSGGDILLLGTGLTMIDIVLSLDSAGFGGRILVLSRRGQMPRSHGAVEPAPVELEEIPKSLLGLWRWLRQRAADIGWRAAIDSLRPHSQALWQNLGVDQQRRFMRHARPFWDVHRHRIAPQVARRIAGLIAEGKLQVMAGRIVGARDTGTALDVDILKRGAKDTARRRFALAINCTGPLQAIGRTSDPLLRGLFDSGAIEPDTLGIGLELGDGARVAGSERLWAMGALTKGRYWEIIAVPDIREQAAAIAAEITEEIGHD